MTMAWFPQNGLASGSRVPLQLTNVPDGPIGTAANTVDKHAWIRIANTDPVNFDIPAPTDSSKGALLMLSNNGAATFFLFEADGTIPVPPNDSIVLVWDGQAWRRPDFPFYGVALEDGSGNRFVQQVPVLNLIGGNLTGRAQTDSTRSATGLPEKGLLEIVADTAQLFDDSIAPVSIDVGMLGDQPFNYLTVLLNADGQARLPDVPGYNRPGGPDVPGTPDVPVSWSLRFTNDSTSLFGLTIATESDPTTIVELAPGAWAILTWAGPVRGWIIAAQGNATSAASAGQLQDWFGDGHDGDHTLAGNVRLTRDMYYRDLTLGNCNVYTNGYRIFVRGTLDISSADAKVIQPDDDPAVIDNRPSAGETNGAPGNAGLPSVFAGLAGGELGGNGGAGGKNSLGNEPKAGSSGIHSVVTNGGSAGAGGIGGKGGGGVDGAAGGAANANTAVHYDPRYYIRDPAKLQADPSRDPAPFWLALIRGGAGGSGGGGGQGDSEATTNGGGGGGGGAGGGVLWIAAFRVQLSASTPPSIFIAPGQAGAGGGDGAADCGGGGGASGGGGGWVYFAYYELLGTQAQKEIQVFAAPGGSGAAGGLAGGAGGPTDGNGGTGGGWGYITAVDLKQGKTYTPNAGTFPWPGPANTTPINRFPTGGRVVTMNFVGT